MSSIEDRVSKLEEEVFGKKSREKNWRSTVGMFGRRRDVFDQVLPYGRLLNIFEFFAEWEIIPFGTNAAAVFESMRL